MGISRHRACALLSSPVLLPLFCFQDPSWSALAIQGDFETLEMKTLLTEKNTSGPGCLEHPVWVQRSLGTLICFWVCSCCFEDLEP